MLKFDSRRKLSSMQQFMSKFPLKLASAIIDYLSLKELINIAYRIAMSQIEFPQLTVEERDFFCFHIENAIQEHLSILKQEGVPLMGGGDKPYLKLVKTMQELARRKEALLANEGISVAQRTRLMEDQEVNSIGNLITLHRVITEVQFTPFEKFLFRLASQRTRPRGKAIVSRPERRGIFIQPKLAIIGPSVITDIIDYFLLPGQSRPEIELPVYVNPRVAQLKQQSRAMHLRKIASLMPGAYYHLANNKTGLSLPLTIIRTVAGQFRLYVEIRDNLIWRQFSNEGELIKETRLIDNSLLKNGSTKSGGNSVRIDGGEIALFGLVSSDADDIQKMKNEVIVTGILGRRSENIDVYIDSACWSDKTFCVYSKKAICSLDELLNRPLDFPLSPNHIRIMWADLLYGLAPIHEMGVVHQDLKTANILVFIEYGEPNKPMTNSYHLKICDFGMVAIEGSQMQETVASGGYQAPEILLAQSRQSANYYSYFFIKNFHQYIKKTIGYKQYIKTKNRYNQDHIVQLTKPCAKTDIFALGIIFVQLKYKLLSAYACQEGHYSSDAFLSKLLYAHPEERPDIFTAIDLFHQHYLEVPRRFKRKFSDLQEKCDVALLYLVLEWQEMVLKLQWVGLKKTLLKKKENFQDLLLKLAKNNISNEDKQRGISELSSTLESIRKLKGAAEFIKLNELLVKKLDEVCLAAKEELSAERKREVADVAAAPLTPLRNLRLEQSTRTGGAESVMGASSAPDPLAFNLNKPAW